MWGPPSQNIDIYNVKPETEVRERRAYHWAGVVVVVVMVVEVWLLG